MSEIKIDYDIPYPGEGIILYGTASGAIRSADIVVEPDLYSDVWELCDFQKYGINSPNRCGTAICDADNGGDLVIRLAYEI